MDAECAEAELTDSSQRRFEQKKFYWQTPDPLGSIIPHQREVLLGPVWVKKLIKQCEQEKEWRQKDGKKMPQY